MELKVRSVHLVSVLDSYMFGKSFPLAFTHDGPWRSSKPTLRGPFQLADMFCQVHTVGFVKSIFLSSEVGGSGNATSILLSDNSQWEPSTWRPFNGSCVSYNCFPFFLLIPAPLYPFYIICPAPSSIGACNSYSTETVLPTHLYLFKF